MLLLCYIVVFQLCHCLPVVVMSVLWKIASLTLQPDATDLHAYRCPDEYAQVGPGFCYLVSAAAPLHHVCFCLPEVAVAVRNSNPLWCQHGLMAQT